MSPCEIFRTPECQSKMSPSQRMKFDVFTRKKLSNVFSTLITYRMNGYFPSTRAMEHAKRAIFTTSIAAWQNCTNNCHYVESRCDGFPPIFYSGFSHYF